LAASEYSQARFKSPSAGLRSYSRPMTIALSPYTFARRKTSSAVRPRPTVAQVEGSGTWIAINSGTSKPALAKTELAPPASGPPSTRPARFVETICAGCCL
jgi:hypothetical protein